MRDGESSCKKRGGLAVALMGHGKWRRSVCAAVAGGDNERLLFGDGAARGCAAAGNKQRRQPEDGPPSGGLLMGHSPGSIRAETGSIPPGSTSVLVVQIVLCRC